MNIKETIRKGAIALKSDDISEPSLKARLLMQYVLNKPRNYLLVNDEKQLSLREQVNYFKLIKKIREGTPLQHITRKTRIYENDFLCR